MKQLKNSDYVTPEVKTSMLVCESVLCASSDPEPWMEDLKMTYEDW